MIRLYDRDARDVSELLGLLAPFFENRIAEPDASHRLTVQLARWEPKVLERTHTDRLRQAFIGDVVSARLLEIVDAINEQLPASSSRESDGA
jgi:hypothetical protein